MSIKNTTYTYGLAYNGVSKPYAKGDPIPTGPLSYGLSVLSSLATRTTTPDSYPDWRSRIANGASATTNLSARKQTLRQNRGDIFMISRSTSGAVYHVSHIWGHFGSADLSPVTFSDSLLQNRALMSFLSKVRETQTLFQSGVFIGELKETIELVTRPAKLIRSAIERHERSVKKLIAAAKKPKGSAKARARQLVKAASNEWLEFKFGVQPLIADVQDGAKALADLSLRRESRKITGGAESDSVSFTPAIGVGSYGDIVWSFDQIAATKNTSRYIGAVWCNTENCTAFVDKFGFTPQAWAPTLWELIPYSFLIDYFVNVGDLINAVSYGYANVKWSLRTNRTEVKRTRYATNIGLFANPGLWFLEKLSINSVPSTVSTATHVDRIANPSLTPQVIFSIPGIGSTRWINIAALAASRDSNRSLRL